MFTVCLLGGCAVYMIVAVCCRKLLQHLVASEWLPSEPFPEAFKLIALMWPTLLAGFVYAALIHFSSRQHDEENP